jgi:hypothetical protein
LGTIMFPRGPCCCGNFAKDLEEEKWNLVYRQYLYWIVYFFKKKIWY